jgi:hypothetical protein
VVLTNDDKISQKWSTRQFAMSGVPYDGCNGEVGTICLSLASRGIRLGKGACGSSAVWARELPSVEMKA